MSLLGGMIAGGLSGGANAAYDMADKTIDHNRRTDMSDIEFKRNTALEQMRTQSAMARDDISHSRNLEQYDIQRGHAIEDRDFAAQHATKLAGIRASATGSRSGDNAQLKGWESERDYLRDLAESSGLTPDQEDLLWTLESNINSIYGIPFTQQLAPSILADINAQVEQKFKGKTDTPEAKTFRDSLIAGYSADDDDILSNPEGVVNPNAGGKPLSVDPIDTTTTNTARNQPQPTPEPKTGLLGLSQDQIQANPSLQGLQDGRANSNETMSRQWGEFKDRFFNKDMQESEQVAFKRFGERLPLGNPEWEQWLSQNYPEVYQRRVERGEIKP